MKLFLAHFTILSLLLSGCSFSKYSPVEYNNTVAEEVNVISEGIQNSATTYNASVPNTVTEKDEVDVTEMKANLKIAQGGLKDLEKLFDLESRDPEQEKTVEEGLATYQDAATLYMEAYVKVLDYYETGTYKEDLSQVEPLDEELHTHYTTFIEANNDLVELLEEFVKDV